MEKQHMCKFCGRIFPCGRSLGGHMRSHLISNSPPSDHPKTGDKLPRKKLPPHVNGKATNKPDSSMDGGDQFGPKKTCKFAKASEEDALLQEKACKECGKSFQSWKALFGHMKCHSVNGKMTSNVEEDSWKSCDDDHQKLIMDSQSDNEAATPFCRRKRSDRMKRYTAYTNSSSLTIANFSPSVSEIDQHDQQEEEVALSLIILSRDKGDWGGINSAVESSDNSSDFLEDDKKITKNGKIDSKSLKFKKLSNVKQFELESLPINDEFDIECKTLIKKNGIDEIETESKKKRLKKIKDSDGLDVPIAVKKSQNLEAKTSKFACSICKKAFPSYQALGGHRASHKKFKGCCFPRSGDSLETENSHNQGEKAQVGCRPNKEHECPICFKVFSSGQALGGHKRSHLIGDQPKNNPTVEIKKPVRDVRGFLDLNLPAPDEEECNELKPWWIGTSHKPLQLLGLLSS